MNWRPLLDAALDIIYPRIDCVSCSRLLAKDAIHGLCRNCSDFLPYIREPKCTLCGKPLEDEGEKHCPDCQKYGHHFDQALSVFELSISVQELIYRYKYDREFSLSRTLAYFMSQALQASQWKVDLILPVPLHKNRLKHRGFNQAALLGDYISYHNKIVCMDSVLIRNTDTKTQTGLNRLQRAQNLRNVFTVTNPDIVKGNNILLVDDVYTTGATASR
jgi:competence protein ComFC